MYVYFLSKTTPEEDNSRCFDTASKWIITKIQIKVTVWIIAKNKKNYGIVYNVISYNILFQANKSRKESHKEYAHEESFKTKFISVWKVIQEDFYNINYLSIIRITERTKAKTSYPNGLNLFYLSRNGKWGVSGVTCTCIT